MTGYITRKEYVARQDRTRVMVCGMCERRRHFHYSGWCWTCIIEAGE